MDELLPLFERIAAYLVILLIAIAGWIAKRHFDVASRVTRLEEARVDPERVARLEERTADGRDGQPPLVLRPLATEVSHTRDRLDRVDKRTDKIFEVLGGLGDKIDKLGRDVEYVKGHIRGSS